MRKKSKKENETLQRKKELAKIKKQKENLRHKKQLAKLKRLKFPKRFFDTENRKHDIKLDLIKIRFAKTKKHLSPETIAKIKRRRNFATTKIGKHPSDVKTSNIIEGRLNQITLKYKIGKNKYEVSVVVKRKQDLKQKLKTLLNFPKNSGDLAKTKFISVERYLVKKKKSKK